MLLLRYVREETVFYQKSITYLQEENILGMSKAARLTFGATALGTATIVYLVHYGQKADQAVSNDFPFFEDYRYIDTMVSLGHARWCDKRYGAAEAQARAAARF